MDESWRCTMGSVMPRQRSSDLQLAGGGGGGRQGLAPDDFRDVFGGPPRTVLLRSFYGEADSHHQYSPSTGQQQYYHTSYGGADAFSRRPPHPCVVVGPAAVPTEEGFFDDIFGARHVRSRSRSRSTKSSSVVSSDEFGPAAFCRPAASGCRGDAALSSLASKLRPIAIPSRRYDSSPPSTTSTRGDYQSSFTCSTAPYQASRCYYGGGRTTNYSSAASSNAAAESSAAHHHHHHRHHRGSSGFCCFTSNPETTSNGHSFRRTRGRRARSPSDADTTTATTEWSQADYGYYYSPPSAASSSAVFGNPLPRTPLRLEQVVMEVRERAPLLMDDGDIDSVGAAAVDEAIAWAKERFWSQA